MRYVCLILMLCILLGGCATIGLDSQPLPATQPTTMPATAAATTSLATCTTVPMLPTRVPQFHHPYDESLKLDLPKLSEMQLQQIREDYCASMKAPCEPEEVMLWFIGVFEDTYVLFVDVPGRMYLTYITKDVVAGYTFVYGSSHKMEVYHDGSFYTLNAAYDAGYLTKENVAALYENYYFAFPHFADEDAK